MIEKVLIVALLLGFNAFWLYLLARSERGPGPRDFTRGTIYRKGRAPERL